MLVVNTISDTIHMSAKMGLYHGTRGRVTVMCNDESCGCTVQFLKKHVPDAEIVEVSISVIENG